MTDSSLFRKLSSASQETADKLSLSRKASAASQGSRGVAGEDLGYSEDTGGALPTSESFVATLDETEEDLDLWRNPGVPRLSSVGTCGIAASGGTVGGVGCGSGGGDDVPMFQFIVQRADSSEESEASPSADKIT